MSRRKSFKLHVDNIVTFNVEGLDFSITRVQIKNEDGIVYKTVPLNHLSQAIVTVQSQQNLVVIFSLLQPSNLGARQYRIFAQGQINVENQKIQSQPVLAVGCPIRHIVSKKSIISLTVVIKEDLQKITYFLPQSQASSILDEQIQPVIVNIPSPQQTSRESESEKKKLSPIKRIAKKPVRNRHFEYQVKSQSSNAQLNNKVTDEESISVENLTFQIDDAISSIQFYGSTYREMLAQVLFKTNPTQEDLKHLKIKVPESQKVIDIKLNTLQGGKLYASTNLPNLQQNQCLKISCDFKDENNDVKGRIKFNYKQNTDKFDRNEEKMLMSQEIGMFEKSKLRQQLQFLPFLFSDHKLKPEQPPKLKLPKISKKEPKFGFQTIINQKIKPEEQSPRHQNQISSRQPKLDNQARNEAKNQGERLYRSKTIHSRSQLRPPSPSPRIYTGKGQDSKNIVRIMGVSVKFYKSFIEKNQHNLQKEPFTGKFLQIYSNSANIYRSPSTYANTTLNWKLHNCQIQITEYDNLTVELNLQKQKTLLGELIISYNQLKFNQEDNFLYFGYLTRDYDTIAKICIEFLLFEPEQKLKSRTSVMQRTERRTRMKRLYSEDIAYIGNEELVKKQNSNKMSLYESLAIPMIPEKVHNDHRSRLCEQQRQIQLIRQRKRRKIKSPVKKQKPF